MPENNNIEFDFTYGEAETVDRLKALATVNDTFLRRGMQKALAGGDESDDFSTSSVVLDMLKSLDAYGRAKGYDIESGFEDGSYPMHVCALGNELFGSPLGQAYDKLTDDRLGRQRKRDEERFDVAIDESQFEVPDQKQKTL